MEYLDGEGTVASRAVIEAHLAHCGAATGPRTDDHDPKTGAVTGGIQLSAVTLPAVGAACC